MGNIVTTGLALLSNKLKIILLELVSNQRSSRIPETFFVDPRL
jgi:hypothetical protein